MFFTHIIEELIFNFDMWINMESVSRVLFISSRWCILMYALKYSLVEGNKIFSFFLLCFFDFLASPRSFFWVCKSLDCQVSKRRTEWNIRKWLGKRGRLLNSISAHVLQRIIEKIVVYYSSRWYSSSFFPPTLFPFLVVLRAAAPTTSAAAVVTS